MGDCWGREWAGGASDEAGVGDLDSSAVPGAASAVLLQAMGGARKAKNGRLLDGRTYDEYPERVLRPVPDRADCIAWAEKFGRSLQASALAVG